MRLQYGRVPVEDLVCVLVVPKDRRFSEMQEGAPPSKCRGDVLLVVNTLTCKCIGYNMSVSISRHALL